MSKKIAALAPLAAVAMSVAGFTTAAAEPVGVAATAQNGVCNGKGQPVKNNVASVCNNMGRYMVRVSSRSAAPSSSTRMARRRWNVASASACRPPRRARA